MIQASKRYAEALFKSAQSDKKADQIQQELRALENLIEHHAIFKKMLHNPLLNKKEVGAALLEISTKLNLSSLSSHFLQMLVFQKRLPLLLNIIASFNDIIDRTQGVLNAYVISAHKMSDEQKASLKDLLEQKLSSKIKLHEQINQELLGGFIIQIGPYLFDNTLSYKLKKINQSLKKVI